MKKTTLLKRMILSSSLDFLMEAHNGLSAKIAEEAGFKGLWASGLSISASLGVRDNNEASWTQVLEVVEFMSDASSIPILMDGDTGYGNFNNMRRLVKKLGQRNIAGVCIEDKIFPKTNSFLRGNSQSLVSIEEFTGKIKAGKDSQIDDDFIIVARVEAFIANLGLKEAIERSEAYQRAGADAILIHSNQYTPDEILSFLEKWGNRSPVIIIPTKYYTTPTEIFKKYKVSIIIWANHLLRGAIKKMQEVASKIYKDENLLCVEGSIAGLGEVFRLQGDDELKEAEKRYTKCNHQTHSAIILAASRGLDLGILTDDIPKTMIKIGDKSILQRIIDNLTEYMIKDIIIVGGYKNETINISKALLVHNHDYQNTNEVVSLSKAIDYINGPAVILFGDIIFKKYVPLVAIDDPSDIVIVVDADIHAKEKGYSDYVFVSKKINANRFYEDEFLLKKAVFSKLEKKFDGEWIGLMKLSENGVKYVKDFLEQFKDNPILSSMQLIDMLNYFVEKGIMVKIKYIHGHWADVDNLMDLNLAANLLD